MKRTLKVLAVLWAVALVGWGVASAQGWLGGGEQKPVRALTPRPPPLLHATKSDAGEGIALDSERVDEALSPQQRREGEGKPAAPSSKPTSPEPPPPEPAPLLPSTKSGLADGIGGLQPPRGIQIGLPGLGPRTPAPAEPDDPPPAQERAEGR